MTKTPTKAWLKTIEERLHSDKKKAIEQIAVLKKGDPFMDPEHISDNAAIDTDVREQESHQVIEAEIGDLQNKIVDIDMALKKLAKGQYGLCSKCNKPIPQARLELLPEAVYCVECEANIKK